jgi:hypothetical protein
MSVVIGLSPRGDSEVSPPHAAQSSLASDVNDGGCILEPVCLEEFVFSTCPHPDVPCVRHRYESLADGEGERAYGAAAWKLMKSVDPVAVIQMIEGIRGRDSSYAP